MAHDGQLELSLDSEVTRIVFSEIDDEDADEGAYSRVLTIETAAGSLRIELFAGDPDALAILTEEG